ncbi:hypothetical protein NP233_g5061 [Leucocoprinus birnbaumii]|uniref:Uncharacterized protein n=1 Tax=Leucocoprinus birnbaumii TaxID=56174 RepID=A0AAD5VTM2_9AGAR|nr:hypothetical protein NP233_g5061 [Leucocoprinus birnbaumii]
MTSSFSSFPSAFSSFPDLEPGPSNRQSDSEPPRDKKRKHEKSTKPKDKERRRDRSRSRERDKERRKERERSSDRDGRKREKEKERWHESRERHKQKDKDRTREKDKERERDKEHKLKRKHRVYDDDGEKSKPRTQAPSLEEFELEFERQKFAADPRAHDDSYKIFFTDTKGDSLTLQYGGIYAGDIPRYRLHRGGRQILGLSSAWMVYRRAGKGIEVGLKGTQKASGLSDSSARSLLALPPTKKILASTTSTKYEEVDGVIRLPSRRGRRDPEDSYRAITTARDSDSDSDSSVGSADDESDEESSDSSPILTSQQIAIKQLELELSEDPSAVDKWLSLLNRTLSTIPITSRNATKARSEITVSILSRALSATTKNGLSRLLRLRYMKAGEEIWQEAKLNAEWEEALKVGGTEIWMEWLEWRIRSMKNMDGLLTEVLRVYSAFDKDEGEFGELAKLRVFWRVAVLYRDAGFTEKAMAMFQAQAELTFKHPANIGDVTTKTRLSELEEFWDSEMPRVGEEGAEGWTKWHASGKPEAPIAPITALDTQDATQLDPFRQWSFNEAQRDQSSLLPAKSFDKVAEVDPYATVLFSDIRPFLFEIRRPGTGFAFRLAWLSFLGLHVPGFATSLTTDFGPNWDDRWNTGYLTRQSHLDVIFPATSDQKAVMTESAAGVLVGREKEYSNSFSIPVKEWGKAVIGCLDVVADCSKGKRSCWNQEDIEGVDVSLVRRVFAQLRMGARDIAWDEMALGFESAVNAKNSLKLSKSLLSTAQDSLLHWAAHAQLERLRGRLDDSRKVYHTVLVASRPPIGAIGAPLLWYNWAELEWLAGQDEEAMNIIFRSVNMETTKSGVALLRAKRKLEDAAEALASAAHDITKMKERESWVKLRAMLEILAGSDVAAMLRVFDRYLQPKDLPDATRESMTVASLIMLYRYGFILKNPMPPMILRDRVSVALEAYPSNSVILGIFLEGEKGQGVWGKVRGILGDNEVDIGKVKDVARRIEEVWIAGWEKGRWRGEIERTRSGLSGAVESERTRASPIIWRIYLEFEIRAGDLKRAKKLLYRAIGECPFCKGLYLLAFGVLRSVFTAQELNSLADLMAERGLRLRKGLDEVLDGWEMEGVEHARDDSEEAESEIEQRAAELRRLMPTVYNHEAFVDASRLSAFSLSHCPRKRIASPLHPRRLVFRRSLPPHCVILRQPLHNRFEISENMPTIPAPTLVISREEWPDADFDLPDGAPITAQSDKDDDNEDWDIEMDLGQTGGAKAQAVIAGITARSELASSLTSQSQGSSMFTIRPPIASSGEEEDDDEGVSTIKALDTLKASLPPSQASDSVEDDFEDGFALPSDLTQLSLAPLSLHHRSSKNSLEWGDRDQTSSSQSSDAYSTLGFADASPSSNSVSSVSLPETETEDDDEQDDLDGLVIPSAIFESGSGSRQLNKILELKKKASYITQHVKMASPDPEDDFESGLILDDDADLSPSRLLQNTQNQRPRRHFDRSYSAPPQRPSSASLRPPSRIKSERAKSPSGPPPSSVRQLQKLRLSPSPPLQPPPRSKSSFGSLGPRNTSPSPSAALLVPKPGSLRGQKSHTGLKPPTPTTSRKLTRKASLSSLLEMSHANAPEPPAVPSKTRARYEVPTASSAAKAQKGSSSKQSEYSVPPTRPHTPSSNAAALRLTMPTQMKSSKSRPSLSQVFSSATPSPVTKETPPLPPPPRPPSNLSLRRSSSRISKAPLPSKTPPPGPVTPPAPKVLKRPKRQKTYGDGTELDAFDDLPTDRDKETRYRVTPKGYGNRVPGASFSSSPKLEASPTAAPAPGADNKGTLRRKKRAESISNDAPAIPSALASATNTLRRTTTRIEFSSKVSVPPEPLPKKKKTSSPSGQTKRKPTLIRNLGGTAAPKVVGDMKWNPQTLRWEGNDQVLKDFDAAVATSTRPALITHLTGTSIGSPVGSFASGARRVGNMIFDPQQMCWISALSPEEDEPDVFANLADDENENDWDSKNGTIRASIQRTPSEAGSANTTTTTTSSGRLEPASPARSLSQVISDSESDRGSRASMVVCEIDDAFITACRVAEERHRQEMKGWRSTLSRHDVFSEPDRSHLYEIRALATRRY